MSTIADLLIRVRADVGGAEKDIRGFGSRVGSGFSRALLPATAALGTMAVVGKAAFNNLQDGARNAKQTEAVLASTGDAANVTAKHVDDLSMSLRRKAGVDDDVIHSGANLLLTFTNIRNEAGRGNDIFDQATKTMLDMSHALGQDTRSSAIQLGKALNDPVRGMTALQRVGVSFTAAQKKQVQAMVDSGHAMDAQKFILHELNKEFGGSATNIDPTTRALANLKLDATDMASTLVAGLLPALRTFVSVLQAATSFMAEHSRATKVVVGLLAGLAVAVVAVNVAMKAYAAVMLLVRAAVVAWTAAQWLLNAAVSDNPIGVVILALAALGVALVALWKKSETFRNIVTGAWNAVRAATVAVWDFIRDHLRLVLAALVVILTGGLGALVLLVVAKWGAIRGATTAAWDAVSSAVTGAVGRVRAVVADVFGVLGGIVKAAAGAVRAGVAALEGALSPVLAVLHSVEGAASAAAGAIQRVVSAASAVKGAVGGALGKIPGFAGGVRNFGGGLAVVGENGPELVNLPGGSDVYTNAESRGMLGGLGGLGGGGDIVLALDGEVLARFTRRELERKGRRNVRLTFGAA